MKMNTAEGERRVSAGQVAQALLYDVYCPLTALVSLNACGALMGIRLFDTQYAPLPEPETGCASVWLIFGHPDGWQALHPEEERRLHEVRKRMGGRPVRVFLAGEELGCVELPMEECAQAL